MSLQYRETIEHLYGLKRLGIRPGLASIEGVLRILGHPERYLRAVHVAGTNGKGSTSAMIASVLKESGYRTGLFTSPHLTRLNERISISGADISDEALLPLAGLVLDAAKRLQETTGLEVTFFEAVTAMALLYFRERDVDIAILETGMGGRLDATNAAEPLISIITNIALDHSGYLGEDLEKIAFEKAGIIKKGVPVVSGVDEAGAARVILQRAIEVTGRAPLRLGHDFSYKGLLNGAFDYSGQKIALKGVRPGLRGAHQLKNAAIALAAIEQLGRSYPDINEISIRAGLSGVRWPGRFEIISREPVIILDCAHNPDGARALAAAIRKEFPLPLTMTLITGISADKDIYGILGHLAPLARRVILTEACHERAASSKEVRKAALIYQKNCEEEPSVERAIASALRDIPTGEIIVIAGSIFVAGEARDLLIRTRESAIQEESGKVVVRG